jgi:hypothetical protein
MSRIVAWTGHRPDLFRDPAAARAAVEATAHDLVTREDVARFLVGGQRGVDTWAAQAATALGVPFMLVLPLDVNEFTHDWASADRQLLDGLLAEANEVRVVGGEPAAAYTERNRRLATQADLLVAVWTQLGGGGTAETITLARAAGTPVREIVLQMAQIAHSPHSRGI